MSQLSVQATKVRELVPFMELDAAVAELRVSGLATDSRQVQPGDCFLAYPGYESDGRNYIDSALNAGACCALAEAKALKSDYGTVPAVVAVSDLKKALPGIAKRFYGDPSAHLTLIAITGTNGKTSVSHLIATGLTLMNVTTGLMGTLGNGKPGALRPTLNTTPDVVEANKVLAELVAEDVDTVVLEASSHGLVEGRLSGLQIKVGVVTNISRDHLDFHGSMDAYRDAKALLMRHAGLQQVVLNVDDELVKEFAGLVDASVEVWTYSMQSHSDATVVAQSYQLTASGIELHFTYNQQQGHITSPLLAEFNVSNLLAATTVLLAQGYSLTAVCQALSQVQPIPGRMQRIEAPASAPTVVVDFAHTPDALEKALTGLRHHCSGALWCVFGCGGNRDRGKRPLMVNAVVANADQIVMTADNPRTEPLTQIFADMRLGLEAGNEGQNSRIKQIDDRAAAVKYVIENAAPMDVILLAGKGHEQYQDIAGEKQIYSDTDAAEHWLALCFPPEVQL